MTKVAIQGIHGSYSEDAATILLDAPEIVECRTFADTFAAVSAGLAECAVVPLTNKIVGEIYPATNALGKSGLKIGESIELKVRHVLAGIKGSTFKQITEVVSHPEAIKQCSRFLIENGQIQAVAADDTASSVRRVTEAGEPFRAAIGSERAAALFGAEIIARDIADDIDNFTTFYLVRP